MHFEFEHIDPQGLRAIFDCTKVSDLTKRCSKLVIYGDDFANLIVSASDYSSEIAYMPMFRHYQPEHLALTEADLSALARTGVGPLADRARITVRKIHQMLEERRLFNGHLFWQVHEPGEPAVAWHLFYFDQRDTSQTDPHWKHGSHIHLMNHLTHQSLTLNELLGQFDEQRAPKLGGGLHIRFQRYVVFGEDAHV